MGKFYAVIFLFVITLCSCDKEPQYHRLVGETMGTYYSLTYEGIAPIVVREDIEELLREFNNSLSTYIPSSFISQLNASKEGIALPDNDIYFAPVLERAIELKSLTNDRLNVMIMPLLKYWRDNSTAIDTSTVMQLREVVHTSDFSIIQKDGKSFVKKTNPDAKLDFSALAKGYGIDVLGDYFENKGIKNFLVDIGGEATARGVNPKGISWSLAINTPKEGSSLTDMEVVIGLQNKSIATSGTYRQFYEKEGKKIAHIMDPISGYSTTSDLLSASVIANDCMTADGVATALMVMDMKDAKEYLKQNNYPACLIYDKDGVDPLEKLYFNGFDSIVITSK